jgi:hypothetical protein
MFTTGRFPHPAVMSNLSRLLVAALFSTAAVTTVGCGDDTSTGGGVDMSAGSDGSASSCTSSNGGGPVAGAADRHCYDDGGGHFVTYDPAQCSVDAGNDGSGGASDFGDTMYGTSGNDDDCKYAVSYSVAPICENDGVSFTVTLKDAVTLAPVTYAGTVRIEAFLTDTHPANTSATTSTLTAPGVYKIGPVAFDAAGTWTVRFHFFEDCTDSPTSPHGHAAFFVKVP